VTNRDSPLGNLPEMGGVLARVVGLKRVMGPTSDPSEGLAGARGVVADVFLHWDWS